MKKINKLKDEASKILKSPNLDNQKLEEALNKYTEAIDLKIKDKINSTLFSNRAWVNLKLERNGAALEDANKAIKWDPNNIKGYYRRGCANLTLCKYEEALTRIKYKESNKLKHLISMDNLKSENGIYSQKELITKGYAKVAYIYGDYEYVEELRKSEELAKKNQVGIWQEINIGDTTQSETKEENDDDVIMRIIKIIIGIIKLIFDLLSI